jgi:hypothetical protein
MKTVGQTFRALSKEQRDSVCSSFVGVASWDITDLKSSNFTKSCGHRDKSNSKECRDTVTVQGRCYYVGSVNYMLYGRMFRLCEKWSLWKDISVWLYKGIPLVNRSSNYIPSQQWAKIGYNNWVPLITWEGIMKPASSTPQFLPAWEDTPETSASNFTVPPADRKNCAPCDERESKVLKGQAGGMRW